MSIAYIALGSNLGDKEANLRQALKMLLVKGDGLSHLSPLQTPPRSPRSHHP